MGLGASLSGAIGCSYAVEQRLGAHVRGGGGRERRVVWSGSDQYVGNSYSVLLRDGSPRALAVVESAVLVLGDCGCTCKYA